MYIYIYIYIFLCVYIYIYIIYLCVYLLYVCIYIYIYIYICTHCRPYAELQVLGHVLGEVARLWRVRPISLLTLSLLTLLESNFPGKSPGNPYGPGNSTPLN